MNDETEQTTPENINLSPVALIRSCYTERFGIPRQPGLVTSARASLIFANTDANRLSLRDLDDFSHIWVLFVFHKQKYLTSKPLVNPPRLGGKKSMGVFATRSPNRPNPIGMSAVVLESIEHARSEILVHISGGDFLDGTPVIDVKPYVPHIDSIVDATSTWANSPDTMLPVIWSGDALQSFETNSVITDSTYIKQLIEETIAQDPRPAYERNKDGAAGQQWHMKIAAFDVSWRVHNATAEITKFKNLPR